MTLLNYLKLFCPIKNLQISTERPSILAKYKNHTYKTGSSDGGGNMDFTLIMCEDKICIL